MHGSFLWPRRLYVCENTCIYVHACVHCDTKTEKREWVCSWREFGCQDAFLDWYIFLARNHTYEIAWSAQQRCSGKYACKVMQCNDVHCHGAEQAHLQVFICLLNLLSASRIAEPTALRRRMCSNSTHQVQVRSSSEPSLLS